MQIDVKITIQATPQVPGLRYISCTGPIRSEVRTGTYYFLMPV